MDLQGLKAGGVPRHRRAEAAPRALLLLRLVCHTFRGQFGCLAGQHTIYMLYNCCGRGNVSLAMFLGDEPSDEALRDTAQPAGARPSSRFAAPRWPAARFIYRSSRRKPLACAS